ncbi:helix-turn-helix domain-containing protein [Streptomyces diastaticus]
MTGVAVTLAEVARRAGVSVPFLSQVENGRSSRESRVWS